jgi:predicted kinase
MPRDVLPQGSLASGLIQPAKREVVQALFKERGIDLSTGQGSEAVPQEQNMATLHLMIGLPCSGKTTYARQLAGETNALLLTLDVWHLKLFGHDVGHEHHDERHERIEKIMWDVAKHVLEMGGDVILDYGCWARVERDDYRNRAKELGADFKLHYMDVPYSELYRRLEERNRNLPDGAFEIPKAEMDRYITIFQPPTGDELV